MFRPRLPPSSLSRLRCRGAGEWRGTASSSSLPPAPQLSRKLQSSRGLASPATPVGSPLGKGYAPQDEKRCSSALGGQSLAFLWPTLQFPFHSWQTFPLITVEEFYPRNWDSLPVALESLL
ncbi:hypothetical protein THAOC_32015 [Thalassiosira oceanica]|uniref:Uncharacterized protein n=1 Tax=Thalassiosira oceanica TaxID=159749 RepID=K0R836_THAOC|nr:hypothetical protein THAOC_32015 [Thalassiosira oceanica]|eukprot:EJK49140.1 hypothetical protein THAOC_32015 [Thalassiosira oceanica]